MLLIAYDIKDNKLRTRFSNFIHRFGTRIQLSVFEIQNSEHVLKRINEEIKKTFSPLFTQDDSVLIYKIGDDDCIEKYGFPKNENGDFLIK